MNVLQVLKDQDVNIYAMIGNRSTFLLCFSETDPFGLFNIYATIVNRSTFLLCHKETDPASYKPLVCLTYMLR